MATYFQPPEHHHHHHNNHHHGNTSDVDGGLQTLLLMNPNYVGYSESHAPPPSSPSPASNFLLHAPTLYHAPPPPPLPQLVGVPLQSSSDAYTQHYWAQLGHMAPERESPRAAQQGLSLSLSSSQNHSFSRAAAQAEPHQLQPSPSAEQNVHGGSSESPVATTVSAGDVAGLMNPSKYLKAAQQLLEEVVSVTVDRVKSESVKKIKIKGESPPASDSVAGDGSKEERAAELSPADKQELQMKKAKLITLLDEVEQRQRQYHQQMQAVVGSFEQVAGPNSARTYTCLALKTISSQFRFLRGAISGQIRAANRALGEGEGEGGWCSSRLKMLDQQIRQQGALQQLGMMQNNAWRPQRGLPEKAVSVLRAWLFEHFLHPYPKDSDKIMLAKQTGLTRSQVSNWFINARVRLWKPMIEEMYAEEVKEHQQSDQQHTSADGKDDQNGVDNQTKAPTTENHTSSVQISSSTTSIPPFKTNTHNPFTLVDDSEAQGILLKKQRNNEFPDSELFTSNNCKEEVQQHKYNLVPYPIGEISNGQFPTNFSGNGVSLTLGLPHCESISIQGNNQAFLPTNQEMDQYRARMEMAPNSGNAYAAAQLLHDFVA